MMRIRCRGCIAAALAAVVALTSLQLGTAQAAGASKQPQAQTSGTFELSARKRHHYRRGNSRAALQMFSLFAGTIASIAAAEEARRYRDRYGYYGHYGYPRPPPYGYYGPYYRY